MVQAACNELNKTKPTRTGERTGRCVGDSFLFVEPMTRIECLIVMNVFVVMFLFAAGFANAQGLSERKESLAAPRRPTFRLPVPKDTPPKLRNDDAVRMKLVGVPEELTGEFKCEIVVGHGSITVPMIGKVRVAGHTPSQVAAAIERELIAKKLFTAPRVSLERIGRVPVVTIRGDVRAPGRIAWVPGFTLLAAYSASGGASGWDDNFTITRAGKVTHYSRKSIRTDPKLDPKLEPGDLIEVTGEY